MVVLHLVQALLIHYGAVMSEGREAARGSAIRHLSGGFGEKGWLASLLRDVTGLDDVVPRLRLAQGHHQRRTVTMHATGIVLICATAAVAAGWRCYPGGSGGRLQRGPGEPSGMRLVQW